MAQLFDGGEKEKHDGQRASFLLNIPSDYNLEDVPQQYTIPKPSDSMRSAILGHLQAILTHPSPPLNNWLLVWGILLSAVPLFPEPSQSKVFKQARESLDHLYRCAELEVRLRWEQQCRNRSKYFWLYRSTFCPFFLRHRLACLQTSTGGPFFAAHFRRLLHSSIFTSSPNHSSWNLQCMFDTSEQTVIADCAFELGCSVLLHRHEHWFHLISLTRTPEHRELMMADLMADAGPGLHPNHWNAIKEMIQSHCMNAHQNLEAQMPERLLRVDVDIEMVSSSSEVEFPQKVNSLNDFQAATPSMITQ